MENFGLMTVPELAKLLNKTESTVRTWRRRGVIPANCFKVLGDSVYVKVKDIQDFLAE